MNKTAIKNFAIWARNKLIADISYRAGLMGITENGIASPLSQSTGDTEFYEIGTAEPYAIHGEEIKQRQKLVEVIRQKEADSDYATAFKYIIEEVAYTWFNRLIAVRFMEVNDYLPSRIRVLSSETGKLEPDLVTNPFDSDLEFTSAEEEAIIGYKQNNQLDEAFRLLFRKQCNALHEILPVLFETTSDYTELLLNLSIIDQEGVVYHLVHDIPEEDFNIEQGGQVEIIGWLYQYYNTEPKADAFAKKGKITKEEIPAVTQLFTPDWIVRYMVENSLGRLWVEGHPETADALKANWKYYLEEAEQEPEVQKKLAEIRKEYAALNPEDLSFADICAGSGHILVYGFDVLMQIYESAGYSQRDAAQSILEHNLYGLDIDDRAAQLAYFAVMMKARQYDRRIFSRGIQPHAYAIQESNTVNRAQLKYFGVGMSEIEKNTATMQMEALLDILVDAKEYGSILNVENYDWDLLRRFAGGAVVSGQLSVDSIGLEDTAAQVKQLIDIGETMARKYWVTCTNPPYAAVSNLSPKVNSFVKKNYPDSKADFFAVFIERCHEMTRQNGYQAMITQHAWMFLSSFEKLRTKMMQTDTINMAHLGARAFEEIGGEVVQTTTFVRRYSHVDGYKGTYCRLIEATSQQGKEDMFLAGENRYFAEQDNFSKIPGSPVAYWVSENIIHCFDAYKALGESYTLLAGTSTGDNTKYQRFWAEVNYNNISRNAPADVSKRWYPCNTGGEFRKYSLNDDYVIDWENDGYRIRHQINSKGNIGSAVRNRQFYFKHGITWNKLSSSNFGVRLVPDGYISDDTARMIVGEEAEMFSVFGFLCSKVCKNFLRILSPTMSFTNSELQRLPISFDSAKGSIRSLAQENYSLSSEDRSSFETSWDFKTLPMVWWSHIDDSVSTAAYMQDFFDELPKANCPVEISWLLWKGECNKRFAQLKSNEEELNRIFIDIYGLQDELTPDVEDKDVTVRKADLTRDIKSLLSYAVGCMFGRYSLDVDGLAYAGGRFSDQWVVVSGQYYKREVVEKYVSEELQRALGMAEVDANCGGNISAGEASAEGRIIRFVRSDAPGGSVHSVQYRRGAGTKLYEGIRELSVDCKGINGGTGDAAYDLCSPEILDAISNRTGAELVRRGWKDAERVDWETIHCTLTTDHCFTPDADNVIPITDEEYLEDDIVARLCEWLKVVYGADTLEANLDFIAKALGNKGNTSREIIRNYFLKDFFADHEKIYQKRPIYWLFDSGKQNGFKALIYLHRYTPDDIGNLRIDYLHRMQRVYESEMGRMQDMIDHSTNAREVAAATKRKEKLAKQLKECREYDEKIGHLALSRIELDLDDGVKVNYRKLQTAQDGKFYEVLADSKNIMVKDKK